MFLLLLTPKNNDNNKEREGGREAGRERRAEEGRDGRGEERTLSVPYNLFLQGVFPGETAKMYTLGVSVCLCERHQSCYQAGKLPSGFT